MISFIDNILKHFGGLKMFNRTNAQCSIVFNILIIVTLE